MRRLVPVSVVAVFLLVTAVGQGDVILPDLPIWSQYQVVFVTAGRIDGTSPNNAVYNSFATAEAARNPELPDTTWHAIVSTPWVDAYVNAPSIDNVPVYNTQGIVVAGANWVPSLYNAPNGRLLSPIMYDQFGIAPHSSNAWTGTWREGGTGAVGARLGEASGPSSTIMPRVGNPDKVHSAWVVDGFSPAYEMRPVYALSTPITVLPDPLSWDNQGDGSNWATAENWDPDQVPDERTAAAIDRGGTVVLGSRDKWPTLSPSTAGSYTSQQADT